MKKVKKGSFFHILLGNSLANLLFFATAPLNNSTAEEAGRPFVWQAVQEYHIHTRPEKKPEHVAGTRRLNSFTSYTHLGTDFGFMGPSEHEIEWQKDEVCIHLGQQPEGWSGMWHSLRGLARETHKHLDFQAAWPAIIQASFQPQISSIRVDVSGRGELKIELKSDDGHPLWSHWLEVNEETSPQQVMSISPAASRRAKMLSWVAEPGSELCVDGLYLGVEMPKQPWDLQVLATCYAKLARSFDESSGFVKDRAHLEDGAFDSLASTGIFALATVALSQPPLEMVSTDKAKAALELIHRSVLALERPLGLLPHFVRRNATGHAIHPGTEYSTVDTAIYYHSLLLCAEILQDEALQHEISSALDQIHFDQLRLPDGTISHGLREDGKTLLPHGWKDWGGETALVLLLQRMVNENAPMAPMSRAGHAWQGTGFIPEIQSLFHPDFAQQAPDALDGVSWQSARLQMLERQQEYVRNHLPGTPAAQIGLYGLSAGEGPHGDAYFVSGVDLAKQKIFHPHYLLMSAQLRPPQQVYTLLRRLQSAGIFTPWGMIEAVSSHLRSPLPMNGSLNAGFETLGAYHLLMKKRALPNAVYEASQNSAIIRRGMELFYPEQPSLQSKAVPHLDPSGRKASNESSADSALQ